MIINIFFLNHIMSAKRSLLKKIKKNIKEHPSEEYIEQQEDITCMTTKSSILYALDKGANPEKLFAEIENAAHIPLEHLVNENNWLNLASCISVMDTCCENIGLDPKSGESYKEIGRSTLELGALSKSILYIPFIIGGPEDLIDFTILFSRQFEKYMHRTISREDENIIIKAHYKDGLEAITRCEWEEGLFEVIPTYFGYEPFTVEQRKCVRHEPPDSYCEYQISLDLKHDKHASIENKIRGWLSRKTPALFLQLKNAFFQYNESLVKSLAETQNALDEAKRRSNIFETYTRKSLVDRVNKGEDPRTDNSTEVTLPILFCDIRDFTTLTKHMSQSQTTSFLNEYFDYMNSPIHEHNGEIDKIMGDCIMAYFEGNNSSKNIENAVSSAIEMRKGLYTFNTFHEKDFLLPMNNGIGINFGKAIKGNMGSAGKLDYTLTGNTVNVASRLESLTKQYRVGIIVSEPIKNKLHKKHDVRFLDRVQVKGDEGSYLNIFEVFDQESNEIKDKKTLLQPAYESAYQAYVAGDFKTAFQEYKALEQKIGPHSWIENLPMDPTIKFYKERAKRLNTLQKKGLLEDWKGIYIFKEK